MEVFPVLRALAFALFLTQLVVMPTRGDDEVKVEDVPTDEGDKAKNEEPSEEDLKKAEESAEEFAAKMKQLKALLKAKGENADPALLKQLEGLQGQLEKLGMADMLSDEPKEENAELLTACTVMSVKRIGATRMSLLENLRKSGEDEITKEEAKDIDLFRQTCVCINELTQGDLDDYRANHERMRILPGKMAGQAQREGDKCVMELEDGLFEQLKPLHKSFHQSLKENVSTGTTQGAPGWLSALLAIPFLIAVLGLAYKMYKLNEERNNPKKKKKGPDSGSKKGK